MARDTTLPWERYKDSEHGHSLLKFYARDEKGATLTRSETMSRLASHWQLPFWGLGRREVVLKEPEQGVLEENGWLVQVTAVNGTSPHTPILTGSLIRQFYPQPSSCHDPKPSLWTSFPFLFAANMLQLRSPRQGLHGWLPTSNLHNEEKTGQILASLPPPLPNSDLKALIQLFHQTKRIFTESQISTVPGSGGGKEELDPRLPGWALLSPDFLIYKLGMTTHNSLGFCEDSLAVLGAEHSKCSVTEPVILLLFYLRNAYSSMIQTQTQGEYQAEAGRCR